MTTHDHQLMTISVAPIAPHCPYGVTHARAHVHTRMLARICAYAHMHTRDLQCGAHFSHCPYEVTRSRAYHTRAHTHTQVTRLLKKGYAYVGWDPVANRGVCKTPPSAEKVLDFLTKVNSVCDARARARACGWVPP